VAAFSGSSLTDKTAVSSANVPIVLFGEVGMSDVNKRYRVGPRTLPCGTPAFFFSVTENKFSFANFIHLMQN
jgi:hypothetical protein